MLLEKSGLNRLGYCAFINCLRSRKKVVCCPSPRQVTRLRCVVDNPYHCSALLVHFPYSLFQKLLSNLILHFIVYFKWYFSFEKIFLIILYFIFISIKILFRIFIEKKFSSACIILIFDYLVLFSFVVELFID